jgi:hypothetical protein
MEIDHLALSSASTASIAVCNLAAKRHAIKLRATASPPTALRLKHVIENISSIRERRRDTGAAAKLPKPECLYRDRDRSGHAGAI